MDLRSTGENANAVKAEEASRGQKRARSPRLKESWGSAGLTDTICKLFFIQVADKSVLVEPSDERGIDDKTRIGLFCLRVMS